MLVAFSFMITVLHLVVLTLTVLLLGRVLPGFGEGRVVDGRFVGERVIDGRIGEALAYIDDRLDQPLDLEEVAGKVFLSSDSLVICPLAHRSPPRTVSLRIVTRLEFSCRSLSCSPVSFCPRLLPSQKGLPVFDVDEFPPSSNLLSFRAC